MTTHVPPGTGEKWVVDDDAHLQHPPLSARISHRLSRHVPLKTMRLPDGPRVSFTFDDVPDSALSAGASALEEHGVRGTFYIAGGLLGLRTADWRIIDADGICELAQRGHEIGCHTFGHHRADWVGGPSIVEDVLRNRRFLQDIDPALRVENFAYPFGYTSFGWKHRFARLFRSCRAIVPGINSGRVDPQFLRAVPLYDGRLDRDAIDRLLDHAQARKGWLIFYTHDVAQRPSDYGCSPALLTHALRGLERRGLAAHSIADAMDRAQT